MTSPPARPHGDVDAPRPGASGRAAWLSVLARAAPGRLAQAWTRLEAETGASPAYDVLRPAETGLVMVRGRMGGEGAAFNLGEMTATRAAVRLQDGVVGLGYIAGRDRTQALTAALADAMLQTTTHHEAVMRCVIEPLAREEAEAAGLAARKAAATRVDFFTMVRTRGPR